MASLKKTPSQGTNVSDDSMSVSSVSRDAQKEFTNIINELASKATFKGDKCYVFTPESVEKLMSKCLDLIDDAKPHSVTPAGLADMSAQLGKLRMDLANAQSRESKLKVANSIMSDEKVKLSAAVLKAKSENDQFIRDTNINSDVLKDKLQKLKSEKVELAKALVKISKSDNAEAHQEILNSQDGLSKAISAVQDNLTTNNSLIANQKAMIKRLEQHVLELNNELNITVANAKVVKPSYSDVASQFGNDSVKLMKNAIGLLSKASQGMLKKINWEDEKDVKNTLFWLHAGLDSSKNAKFKPYAELFARFKKEHKILCFNHQVHFGQVVKEVYGQIKRGDLYSSVSEILKHTDSYHPDELFLSKWAQTKYNVRTLASFYDQKKTFEEESTPVTAINDQEMSNAIEVIDNSVDEFETVVQERKVPLEIEDPPTNLFGRTFSTLRLVGLIMARWVKTSIKKIFSIFKEPSK